MIEVDARGLSCPEPALMAQDTLDAHPSEPVKILVSSSTAQINVSEVAARKGRTAEAERDGDDYVITVS